MSKKTIIGMGAGAFVTASALIGAPQTLGQEGMKLAPYYDSVGVKPWCAGETEVGYKTSLNHADCSLLYNIRYGYYSMRVMEFYSPKAQSTVTPEVHAAIVDTAYNVGLGAIQKSTIIRRANEGKTMAACDAILLYKYVGKHDCSLPGNKVCSGVWKRRLQMHTLCKRGVDNVLGTPDRA